MPRKKRKGYRLSRYEIRQASKSKRQRINAQQHAQPCESGHSAAGKTEGDDIPMKGRPVECGVEDEKKEDPKSGFCESEVVTDHDAAETALESKETSGAAEYDENVRTEREFELIACDTQIQDENGGIPRAAAAWIASDKSLQKNTAEDAAHFAPDDQFRFVPRRQNKSIEMNEFEIAMAEYLKLEGVSQEGYGRLRQVLNMLRDRDGEPLQDVAKLPTQLATLQDRFRKRLDAQNSDKGTKKISPGTSVQSIPADMITTQDCRDPPGHLKP